QLGHLIEPNRRALGRHQREAAELARGDAGAGLRDDADVDLISYVWPHLGRVQTSVGKTLAVDHSAVLRITLLAVVLHVDDAIHAPGDVLDLRRDVGELVEVLALDPHREGAAAPTGERV